MDDLNEPKPDDQIRFSSVMEVIDKIYKSNNVDLYDEKLITKASFSKKDIIDTIHKVKPFNLYTNPSNEEKLRKELPPDISSKVNIIPLEFIEVDNNILVKNQDFELIPIDFKMED